MADHVVDRGIQGVRIVVLADAGRARLQLVDDHPLNEIVDRQRAHAFHRQPVQRLENLGEQGAGLRHQLDFPWRLDHARADRSGAGCTPAVRS